MHNPQEGVYMWTSMYLEFNSNCILLNFAQWSINNDNFTKLYSENEEQVKVAVNLGKCNVQKTPSCPYHCHLDFHHSFEQKLK